jgi:hypothetical protein
MERIAFLREQVRPDNKPEINDTFQHQINILESVDLEKLDKSFVKLTGSFASWKPLNGFKDR